MQCIVNREVPLLSNSPLILDPAKEAQAGRNNWFSSRRSSTINLVESYQEARLNRYTEVKSVLIASTFLSIIIRERVAMLCLIQV